MYKVLLVDDEPAIREGLRTIIQWERLGFVVAGDAGSGREALSKHQSVSPDLIVIDIRMPGMDGLEVIEEIKKLDSKCHFLILSGYADFKYAQQAIGYGVKGYVLKPVDEEEMQEELRRIHSLLEQESQDKKQSQLSTALHREEILKKIILDESLPVSMLETEFQKLPGLPAAVHHMMLILPETEDGADRTAVDGMKRKLGELLEMADLGFVYSNEPYVGVLLKKDLSHPNVRHEVLHKIREAAGSDISFTAAAGRAFRSFEDIRLSYQEAYDLMKISFLLCGQDIHLAGTEARTVRPTEASGMEPDLEALAKKLYYAVDIGSEEGVKEALMEAGEQIAAFDCSDEAIKTSFAKLLTLLLNKISALHQEFQVQDWMAVIPGIYKQQHYSGMMDLITGRILDLAELLGNTGNAPVIKKVMDFIGRHYYENLKLETLAEMFNYNSGYLGKMFKQYTGVSYNTYLDQIRIQNAIGLLGEGYKVHQVSERVGYANVDYFHSKFKKYVGVSPSSFKGSPVKQ